MRAGGDEHHDAPRGAALSALLATDSGLQELMPYLAQFTQGEVGEAAAFTCTMIHICIHVP